MTATPVSTVPRRRAFGRIRGRRRRIGYAVWWLLGRVPGLRWSRFGLWGIGLANRHCVLYERQAEDGRWRRL